MPAERRFAAMGTTAAVVVLAADHRTADELARWAESHIALLERRWSRFLPTSEISRCNASARNRPVVVSADTLRLVGTAVEAWRLTNGAFDPTVHDAMLALGYDRTFAQLDRTDDAITAHPDPRPAPGAHGIVVDAGLCAVTLPEGVSLDPGGIGKGLAADLTAEAVCRAGAAGVLVDLGGDIRVCGRGPVDGGWIIELDEMGELDGRAPRLLLGDAGVATSSTRRRRWRNAEGSHHHLVDPRTGAPVAGTFTAATAIAPSAWLAEAATKAALVLGRTDIHPAVHLALHGEQRDAVSPDLEEVIR